MLLGTYPVGDLTALGFTLKLKEGSIHVTPERIARLRERITLASIAGLAAGFLGTVVSMGLALGPISCLWTRALYQDILSAEFWSQCNTLSPEAAREVEFYKDSLHHRNGDHFGMQIQNLMQSHIRMLATQDGGLLC